MDKLFENRILVLGAGSVSQSLVPLIIDQLVDPTQVTVVDMRESTKSRFTDAINKGVTYINDTLTKENMDAFLNKYLSPGDLLLDLAWNIDANTIIQWAHDNDVLYINTSVEEWEPYTNNVSRSPQDRALYSRHMKLRNMKDSWTKTGPTAIVEHGANPGIVSHLVKRALVEIAEKALFDGLVTDGVEYALDNEDYAMLAFKLGVKVIHIAELDTQVSNKPKLHNEFVNTWSVEGFYEEGIAPAELGWGTHEKKLPPMAYTHTGGPENQIAIAQPGAKTWVRSWVPEQENIGMVIRHGEAFTITDHLTVWKDGKAIYRPTVHYAYRPTDAAIASMNELEQMQWEITPNQRIMNDEIISGEDRLGVLLMGHPYKSWWTGSLLSIDEARKLIPGQSATTVQVASGVFAAVVWAMKNRDKGLLVPDDLPWKDILNVVDPYWKIQSFQSNWDPISTRKDLFKGWNGREYDEEDPWQFTNFLA